MHGHICFDERKPGGIKVPSQLIFRVLIKVVKLYFMSQDEKNQVLTTSVWLDQGDFYMFIAF